VLRQEQLEEAKKSIADLVDDLANRLYNAGKITDKCENVDFYHRIIKIDEQFPSSSVLLHKNGILPTGISDLWSSPELLDISKQILGPNVAGHPVWNLRVKTPQKEQHTVPWHQDNAYLDQSCWEVLQTTAWIPLIDTNYENGCLQVLKGGHRSGKMCKHTCCVGDTWYVGLAEEEMVKTLGADIEKDVITCDMKQGDVLLFNNIIPHRSLNNISGNTRWSLDLRWQNPAQPNGYFGLKDSILMLNENDPNYKIKWEEWAQQSRTSLQENAVDVEKNEFDTSIAGPWMKSWDITHHNRHTDALRTGRVDMA
jgi:ectoine hydroxylase-related dioxygenase (phytanoyl-CoA dioxygenase family)